MENILFRVDSSSSIGTGHVMRDLVLAKQYSDYNIIFSTQELSGNINHKIDEAGYEISILASNNIDELDSLIKKLSVTTIVIDHYGIDHEFEKEIKIKNPGLIIFVLDDTYERHHCDILLNHNISGDKNRYDGLVPSHCELRCGGKYTLLREEFAEEKKRGIVSNIKSTKKTIFLAMGGSDVMNLNPKILNILMDIQSIQVNLITTSANSRIKELIDFCKNKTWINLRINTNNIAKLMAQSDYGIITPSVVANEAYYMGLPFVAIKVSENQSNMFEYLLKNNFFVMERFDKDRLTKFLINQLRGEI